MRGRTRTCIIRHHPCGLRRRLPITLHRTRAEPILFPPRAKVKNPQRAGMNKPAGAAPPAGCLALYGRDRSTPRQ